MAVPRPLSELPKALARGGIVPYQLSCGVALACPGLESAGWQQLVHAQLASRVPGLSERERIRLAAAILEEAELAELDPLFVLAVIEVESGCDPGALSERGAQGLMQLRPSTLRGEAARSALPGGDPSDPVLNVMAGVRYYRRLLETFKSPDLALMAYNAGPNRISGYLRSGGIPERFHAYPRRVNSEFKRLRTALAVEPVTAVAVREKRLEVQ